MSDFPADVAFVPQDQEPPKKNDDPEHRLSHYLEEFLERTLLEPCWFTAQDHSGKNAGTPRQQVAWHAKRKWYGVKPSQLDWRAYQRPNYGEWELKYGTGQPTLGQRATIAALAKRKIGTGCAWTLPECYALMRDAGFQFGANVETVLREIVLRYEAADEAARGPKKPKRKSPARKTGPRVTMGKRAASNYWKQGARG